MMHLSHSVVAAFLFLTMFAPLLRPVMPVIQSTQTTLAQPLSWIDDPPPGAPETEPSGEAGGDVNAASQTGPLFPGLFEDTWTPSAATVSADGSLHFVTEVFVSGQPEVYYVRAKDEVVLEVVNLSQNASSSMHPALQVSDTAIHVVWQDNVSGSDQIYHRWRSDGPWTQAEQITRSPGGAYAPGLFAEQDGRVSVEWVESLEDRTDRYRCTWTAFGCTGSARVASIEQAPAPLSGQSAQALRTLAFLRDGEIWTVREDGSGLRRVTNSGSRITAFTWSPDGQEFAYIYITDEDTLSCDVYIINASGSGQRRLTTDIGATRWVIDWYGDRIAFLREMATYPYVRIATVTTGGTFAYVSGDIENYGVGFDLFSHPRLRWSPNGQWIALSHGLANVVVAPGGVQRAMDVWFQPDWSGDSTHLIYADGRIRKYYPSNGSTSLLASLDSNFPTYSPDNRYIAYGIPYLRRMNSNNTGHVTLTSDSVGFMSWSSLGDKIAYSRWYGNGSPWPDIYGVYVIGSDGSGRRQVSSGYDEQPRWQPAPITFSVAGQVKDANGAGIPGVTISAGGGYATMTDVNGYYTLSGVAAGAYTITPSKSGHAFCPGTLKIAVSSDVSGQDFTGFGASVTLGFCPNPAGYKFSNSDSGWGIFPVSAYDYRRIDLITMFGQDEVCVMTGEICWIKPQANLWHVEANIRMNAGHCDGMASTSLRFFKGLDVPAHFNLNAQTPHDLALSDARRHIAYYFVEQLTDPVAAYKEQIRQNPPSVILDQLRAAIQSGASNPTTLFVRQKGEGGHAVTPYAIEDRGSGVSWVRVYDNNHPDDLARYVIIDTVNQKWSYDLGGMTWAGDAKTQTLGIVPISKYAEPPVCPWCDGSLSIAAPDNALTQEVWLSGPGHLLITDGEGRRLGYSGAQYIDEMPQAYGGFIDGGLGVEQDPIYRLPVSDSYTIFLHGETATGPGEVTISQFGPGYAAQIDSILLRPSTQDLVTITADGTAVTYQPSAAGSPTFLLALDEGSVSYELEIIRAEIDAGRRVTVSAQVASGFLSYSNAMASGSEYDLSVMRVSPTGPEWFVHNDLRVGAGDTHFVSYRGWDGEGTLTLYVDRGSNGSFDDAISLENQLRKTYLPFVVRK